MFQGLKSHKPEFADELVRSNEKGSPSEPSTYHTHTNPLNPFTHGPKHSHTPIPTPPLHDASSLFVMFCDSLKWFVVVHHGL